MSSTAKRTAAPPKARAVQRRPTLDDVRAAYLLILGREPEDEEVLARHLTQLTSVDQLRARFIGSDEFRGANLANARAPLLPLAPDRLAIEVAAEPSRLAAMLERTGAYWSKVGQEAPHWSVLTSDLYRPDRIAETKDAFYASGAVDEDLVRRMLARHGMDPARMPHCVEFGCGVGRATLALAQAFPQVTGCDISRPHLDLAREEAARRGDGNITWHESSIAAPMPARQ